MLAWNGALGVESLLSAGRDCIEPHKAVEAGGGAGEDALGSVREEAACTEGAAGVGGQRVRRDPPVGEVSVDESKYRDEDDDTDVQESEDVIEARGLLDSETEDEGEEEGDAGGTKVRVSGQEWNVDWTEFPARSEAVSQSDFALPSLICPVRLVST